MITPLVIKKKTKKGIVKSTKKESITLNEVNNLDYCLNMIDSVISTTTLPMEQKYQTKIKELETKNIITETEHKYEILEHKYIIPNFYNINPIHGIYQK